MKISLGNDVSLNLGYHNTSTNWELAKSRDSYVKIIFPAGFAGKGVINKGPALWIDGARPPLIGLIMNLTNS